MILSYEYDTNLTLSSVVGRHTCLMRCLPAKEPFMKIKEEKFDISPIFWHHECIDGLGNRMVFAGTNLMHDSLNYTCRGELVCSTYCIPETIPHPMYSLPSQLTTPHQDMTNLIPIRTRNVLNDCMNITHIVHDYIQYTPGLTGINTNVQEVLNHRQGVCQDYAHLMISICRLMGIPTRYACGLMIGEGATHAWVEVYDGQCWYAFDPTNDTAAASGYIKLAHGRDASDCPVSRGIYTGNSLQKTHVNVKVKML